MKLPIRSLPVITDVFTLCVPGGRFAEIRHSNGQASVKLPESEQDAARGLFAASDEELSKARAAHRRAMICRAAAWHLIRARQIAVQA